MSKKIVYKTKENSLPREFESWSQFADSFDKFAPDGKYQYNHFQKGAVTIPGVYGEGIHNMKVEHKVTLCTQYTFEKSYVFEMAYDELKQKQNEG